MFEIADGGTILLDEIGDMDVRLQAKLLQVLQDQEFQRVGGKETIRVDVRIMAATHRDLEKAIIERNFREDLYYRLNVITLHLKHAFMTYHWPGNVRELENVVRKLLILRNPEAIARDLHMKTTRKPL